MRLFVCLARQGQVLDLGRIISDSFTAFISSCKQKTKSLLISFICAPAPLILSSCVTFEWLGSLVVPVHGSIKGRLLISVFVYPCRATCSVVVA